MKCVRKNLAWGICAAVLFEGVRLSAAGTNSEPEPYQLKDIPGGKQLVIAGKEYGPYAYVPPMEPVQFSPDKRQWIVFVRKSGGEEFFVVDGQEHASPVKVGSSFAYTVSENGGGWGASVRDPSSGGSYAILNGKAYGPYGRIMGRRDTWVPVLSANGKTAGIAGWKERNSVVVVVNGKEFGPYQSARALWIDDKGEFWCAVVSKADSQEYILTTDNEYGPYLWISPVFTSIDQRHWGFYAGKAQAAEQNLVSVIDGKELPGTNTALKNLSVKVTQ